MAKKQQENEGKNIQAVEEALSNTEQFIEKNQKLLLYIILGVVVVIFGYMAFQKYYIAPMEIEAQEQMFMAEKYFNDDSLDLALNGDGNYLGLLDIIDEYGMTKSANLADYYAGMAYLKKGEYETAIDHLESFSSDDLIFSTMAKGAIGDAYVELGETEKGADYFVDAANSKENEFTSPIYLMKAGIAFEAIGQFEKALEQYKKIKKDFPRSQESREIGKYISRTEGKLGKSN